MKKNVPEKKFSPKDPIDAILRVRDRSHLNIALAGGGERSLDFLKRLNPTLLSSLNITIQGLWGSNPDAPGLSQAGKQGLLVTTELTHLMSLEGLDLILLSDPSPELRREMDEAKTDSIPFLDHDAARVFLELAEIEFEKARLERKYLNHEEKIKKETQVILDSLPYRIMVINMDRTVATVNQTFLKAFSVTRREVMGRPCHEVRYHLPSPCDEVGLECYLKSRLDEIKEKGMISIYKDYQDDQGKTRYDVITIAPIYDEKGEVVQLLEASRDVTERIQLEKEAEKSNTFFQNVIESTVDGIVVVDTKGNVLIFNEGMERLTGYPSKDITDGGHVTEFYDIDIAKENMKKMRSDQFGPPGKLNPTSMSIATKDNQEIPVTLSASIITVDGQEIGSVGVFTDMREFQKMQKDLEGAHLQLVQSEKIASVGRMAAGVAHEINNPLAGIMIYAELLKENLKARPKLLDDAQEIIEQTLRCKKIVSELLEFSRQSVGKVSSFSMEDLINKTLNLLVHQAKFHDIRVENEIEPEMPVLVGDMGQLQQVFTNLLINAADAMDGKGRLEINAGFNAEKESFIITVSDTGPGIPEEVQDKIFDIFFTTKQVGEGTGLGLSISQNIIKLHGGSITLECPEEGGTRFVLDLPLGYVEKPFEEQPLFIGLNE